MIVYEVLLVVSVLLVTKEWILTLPTLGGADPTREGHDS